jgi:hypothetical protein
MISTFDFAVRYWWLLVLALVVLALSCSYLVKNRPDWVKSGAETVITIIGVCLAVVLAVTHTKYDRTVERREDAAGLIEGSEQEAAMIINRIFSVLEPGVYVASLNADDSTTLVRPRIDANLALIKSRDVLLQLLSQDLPLSAQVITNPTLLKNLRVKIVNSLIQAYHNYEISRHQFRSLVSEITGWDGDSRELYGGQIISLFATIQSIDHLRMIACAANKCFAIPGEKEEAAPCVEIDGKIGTFEEMLTFSEKRMSCKRRFYWSEPAD